jgi:hypothetical protein
MTTMSLHAQIACKPSRQTNHLSKRWGDKWKLIFVAIFSWKHKQYRRGWRRMFEETNRLQSFLTKKNWTTRAYLPKGKQQISEERKRRWKEADRHNAEILIKGNERVLHTRTHLQRTQAELMQPQVLLHLPERHRQRQNKRNKAQVRNCFHTSFAPLSWPPALSLRHLQQKYLLRPSLVIYFFFPSPPLKTKTANRWETTKQGFFFCSARQYPHLRFDMKEISNQIHRDSLKQPPLNTLSPKISISHLCPLSIKVAWLQASITTHTFKVFHFRL